MASWLSSVLSIPILVTLAASVTFAQVAPQEQASFALVNGKWFDGKTFELRTVYCLNGRFTFKKPVQIDRTLDLTGAWIVPPFGEAHNHNLGTGVEEWDKKAIRKYLTDGVFYVSENPGKSPSDGKHEGPSRDQST